MNADILALIVAMVASSVLCIALRRTWAFSADMPACVWTPGTEGLWQWEEAGAA